MCEHKKIGILPRHIEVQGEGVVIKDMNDGVISCQDCKAELPGARLEDYDKANVVVYIPEELINEV